MTGPRPTLLLRFYSLVANLLAPLAMSRVVAKLKAQGIEAKRFPERQGKATKDRPEGPLVWLHAASVGESLSVLRLIEHMGALFPNHSFLLTSGTATSAQIVAKRLPPRTIHQFAPLDSRKYLRRFLDHWRPAAAIFVESELWPQMLRETARAGVPLALVNARISETSARNWKRAARTSRALLSHFRMIHCQDQRTADHLTDLGLSQARAGQNLKSFSGALPFDAAELARMQTVLQGRPVWLASSTHPGEDQIMLEAHQALLAKMPALMLILVPRHPERAEDIEVMIAEAGLHGARRATGERIDGATQVYLADTLAETGLWYALCPITCLCGSFTPVGGHNPYEPAYAGSAVLHGPRYANFAQTYADMDASGGAVEVADGAALTDTLGKLLSAPDRMHKMGDKARQFADAQEDALDQIAQDLSKALSLR
ncbi:3-deoxy-D-manno-octulosonic acid transferase [Roseovarius sp. 2305UL8-3]|uniref:3-deoxy-D-manno-octulosonic acid transferase n=1 Tax=Roseovarius conchicola TaxID=3121636 RepID=UPI003527F2BF